jgi:hypothetical protein
MPARRLRPKHEKPWLPQIPDEPEPEPLEVTCPSCGGKAALTDHACPHCGDVFFERRRGRIPRERVPQSHAADPSVQEFAARMDRIERWTRVLCVVGGILLIPLGVLMFLWGIGLYGALMGAIVVVAGLVCLKRGVSGRDSDLSLLDSLVFWRYWRR